MAHFLVQETTWSNTKIIELVDQANNAVARIVPSLGANLFSLQTGQKELLRTPPDTATLKKEPVQWGVPVLMPPNRITGGRFTFAGKEYQLEITEPEANNHIHGFPVRRPWEVKSTSTDEGAQVTLEFKATNHPDVIEQFPHPFILQLTYTLSGNVLRCDGHISNEGPTSMPFGLGFHPYLIAPDDDRGRYKIRLTPAKQWELVDCLPTGKFFPQTEEGSLSEWQPLHGQRWDSGFALTEREEDGGSRFELLDEKEQTLVTLYAAKEYGHWVIFNGYPGFEGFVSPEPYTCMTNAFNLDLPREISGMAVVEPGESRPVGTWLLQWQQV